MNNIINPRLRLGPLLRQKREDRGISQGHLAKLIGVSIGTIQNYEHDRVQLTVARFDQLAQMLREHRRVRKEVPKPAGHDLLSIAPKTLGFYGRPARSTVVEIDAQIKRACGLPQDAPAQLAWQSWMNGIHRDDRDRVAVELARLDNPRDGVFNLRYRLIGHDRAERQIVDYGRMIFDDSGQPIRLQGFMLDITQERRTKSTQNKIAQILLGFNAAVLLAFNVGVAD